MTRPALFAILLLTASPCAAPEPVERHQVYEAPPELMTVIKALLDASRMYGVDQMLTFGVAFQESRLKPTAKSWRLVEVDGEMVWKNLARGLMQISVQYQDELVVKYLGWHPKAFDWANPVHSAKLGCAMLRAYVKKYGTWGALACYNAGEGRYQQLWKGRRLPAETEDYQWRIL